MTGGPSFTLPANKFAMHVGFTPDGEYAVSCAWGAVYRWNWTDNATSFPSPTVWPGADQCSGMVFSSDGTTALTSGWDGVVRCWNMTLGTWSPILETTRLESVAMAYDYTQAVVAGANGLVGFQDLQPQSICVLAPTSTTTSTTTLIPTSATTSPNHPHPHLHHHHPDHQPGVQQGAGHIGRGPVQGSSSPPTPCP